MRLTLCHALGGTLVLLLTAYEVLGESEHLAAARCVAARALDRLGDDPAAWPSGLPGDVYSPGLMTGLAGTMYAARARRGSAARSRAARTRRGVARITERLPKPA